MCSSPGFFRCIWPRTMPPGQWPISLWPMCVASKSTKYTTVICIWFALFVLYHQSILKKTLLLTYCVYTVCFWLGPQFPPRWCRVSTIHCLRWCHLPKHPSWQDTAISTNFLEILSGATPPFGAGHRAAIPLHCSTNWICRLYPSLTPHAANSLWVGILDMMRENRGIAAIDRHRATLVPARELSRFLALRLRSPPETRMPSLTPSSLNHAVSLLCAMGLRTLWM